MSEASATILFDGHCNLCHGAVVFIIRRDRRAYFKFASLQSSFAQQCLKNAGIDPAALESIILVEEGSLYDRSTAALRIARRLNRLWPCLYLFIIIPRPLRDAVYNWIARNRYRWFGRQEECLVPEADINDRFIK
jgi:predicted DCC family thiol-disulfide oxidoreductase YuxK